MADRSLFRSTEQSLPCLLCVAATDYDDQTCINQYFEEANIYRKSPMTDHRMKCMEIWGSNRAVDSKVTMRGLDVWACSQPFEGDDRGGDIYYLSSCASGRISRLLLADVSGHGQMVAQISGTLRNLMRRHINYISQNRIAEKVNDEFTLISEDGGFATALILTYFAPKRTLTISNAGHPAPFIYSKENGEWTILGQDQKIKKESPQDLPLGVLSQTQYTSTSIALQEGDLVVCFSDAFVEASSAAGELLQAQGLLALLSDAPVDSPDDIIPWIISRLKSEQQSNLTADDATLILLTPNQHNATFLNNLLAPFRLLSSLVVPNNAP